MTIENSAVKIELKHNEKTINTVVENKEIVIHKKFADIAMIKDEFWLNEAIDNPETYIKGIKEQGIKADIFSFSQKLPNVEPEFPYHFEWDNVASIPISSYENWWDNQIHYKTRNIARKAGKKGVTIKIVEFNDDFVEGIKDIYNETPIRQGKPFTHFGEDFQTIKEANLTYVTRSDFVAAYFEDELIGFIQLVYVGCSAIIMQILSKVSHRDKSPTNALIAKCVEISAEKGSKYLIYAKYVYSKKGEDSLSRFKRNNGFEKMDIPQYFVPLTLKGKIALKFGLYKGFNQKIPDWLYKLILSLRKKWYQKK